MQFEITAEDNAKIKKWLKEVIYPPIIERQLRDPHLRDMLEKFGGKDENGNFKYPYTGAIGGGLTFEFTPTSIGVIVKVSYSGVEEKLDLTDYESW